MRLKTVREAKKIKQKELADAIGVSPSLVSKWEKGTRQIDLETAFRISRYLGITLDELMVETVNNGSPLNMDQVVLFDFNSFKKMKYYMFEIFFISSIFIIPVLNLMEAQFELIYIVIIGSILLINRLSYVFIAPRRHIRYLMQSVNVEHTYKLNKSFNVSYHFTQEILYSLILFILQILFVSFTYTVFLQFNDPVIITTLGIWFIVSLFFFGYLLIMSTIRNYPKKIVYHLTNFRFTDSRYHLLRFIILLQNIVFYSFVVAFDVNHSILRLTLIISVVLQVIALLKHIHNTDRAIAYEFDIKK